MNNLSIVLHKMHLILYLNSSGPKHCPTDSRVLLTITSQKALKPRERVIIQQLHTEKQNDTF